MKTRASLLLPLLTLASCADNNASVRIAALCAPPTDPAVCAYGATCDAQWIGDAKMDVGVTNRYVAVVQVDNLLPNNANASTFKTNTNDAYVQEYEVEYEGGLLPTSTGTVLGSAHVPAGGSAVISVLAVNESVGNVLAAGGIPAGSQVDVVAKLRLKGVLADTSAFETGFFNLPIRVCNGCVGTVTCTAPAVKVACPADGQTPGGGVCATP